VLLPLVVRRFSVQRTEELETAPMRKLIQFLREDEFIYGMLGELILPSILWVWLMVGTPLILKSIGIEYNALYFVLSLILWTFAILVVSQSGYYRAGEQIKVYLMNEFDARGEYNGSLVSSKIYGGCWLWWKTKKKAFWGRGKRSNASGAAGAAAAERE